MSTELQRIALLQARLGKPPSHVTVGIGDDAAVLTAPAGEALVWTVDAAVEGVHFRRDLMGWTDIGARATAAAISDLAAMGATPLGVLAALVLPDHLADEDLAALAEGQRQAAEQAGTAVIGGNLTRGTEVSITTTVLGSAPRPIRRDGSRPDDVVWLAGEIGLASAGLALLEAEAAGSRSEARRDEAARAAVSAFLRPVPRIADGVAARAVAHAAIDLSDGLARDLGHLVRAAGVKAVLDGATLTSASLAAIAADLGRDPLDLALHGGDDYALLVVAAPDAVLPGFRAIGRCERGEPAVFVTDAHGELTAVELRGWDHFETR